MTAIINMMFISTITMIIAIILITRRDSESAGKILTENGEKKKFALWLNAGARGQVFAEMALGQEVREKRRKPNANRARWRDDAATLSLEREAERRTIWIVNVILLEGKEVAVPGQSIDDADRAAVHLHHQRI
jgi:hypothetical protein